jgi:Flp pilus assembly protein TadG
MTPDDADGADQGQVMLLIVFFAVIVAGLITVVVDVSTVFLAQREMQSTADGAALAAVQQADLAALYTTDVAGQLPMSVTETRSVAIAYASNTARIPHECSAASYQVVQSQTGGGAERTGVQADGRTVRVELTCKVPLPFVALVASPFTDGVTIDEVAYARSAVTALVP